MVRSWAPGPASRGASETAPAGSPWPRSMRNVLSASLLWSTHRSISALLKPESVVSNRVRTTRVNFRICAGASLLSGTFKSSPGAVLAASGYRAWSAREHGARARPEAAMVKRIRTHHLWRAAGECYDAARRRGKLVFDGTGKRQDTSSSCSAQTSN